MSPRGGARPATEVVVAVLDARREYDAVRSAEELAIECGCPGRVLILTSVEGGREEYLAQLRELARLDAGSARGGHRLRVEQRTARSVAQALDEIAAELGPGAVLFAPAASDGVDFARPADSPGYHAISA